MARKDSFSVYKSSDKLFKKEQTIRMIIAGSQKECGPIDTLEEALKKIKPDEFVPFCKDGVVGESVCDVDPLKWWVVNKVPSCFSWLNGQCSRTDCGFNHGKGTYIRVEIVSTADMFRKRVNKNRKIRINAMKKGYKFYKDIFTDERIPIYYTRKPKETFNKTCELNARIVGEIKDISRIANILGGRKIMDDKEDKKVEKKSSWADMSDEEEVDVKTVDKTPGSWAKVVKGK